MPRMLIFSLLATAAFGTLTTAALAETPVPAKTQG